MTAQLSLNWSHDVVTPYGYTEAYGDTWTDVHGEEKQIVARILPFDNEYDITVFDGSAHRASADMFTNLRAAQAYAEKIVEALSKERQDHPVSQPFQNLVAALPR